MMEYNIPPILLEKLVLPLILGIVGWFVKDYLFAVYKRRDETVRREWEKRLIEVWSPLYYWSGIVMFEGKERGWERHGLRELETILAKSAHLIPERHYVNLLKLVQVITDQKTIEPSIKDIGSTRLYIYDQIITLNYLLYRRNGWFEATTYTDFFASAKYLLRFASQAFKHILGWLIIVSLLLGAYFAYANKMYEIVGAIFVAVSLPILYDWYRQIKIHQKLNRQGSNRN